MPGRLLKIACIEAGLTQRQVAELVGIDEWKLSRIVNGKQVADDDTKAAIASARGRPVEDLFPAHSTEVSTLAEPADTVRRPELGEAA